MQVLTDAQWAKFEAAIAAAGLRGAKPRKNDRQTIEAMWDRVLTHLSSEADPNLGFACIDGTIARAHQKASGARRSRPGRK